MQVDVPRNPRVATSENAAHLKEHEVFVTPTLKGFHIPAHGVPQFAVHGEHTRAGFLVDAVLIETVRSCKSGRT
jgi:hypothetical protein